MTVSSQHRCVFVGNIPYDASEEELIRICEEVGPVVSFRLVIDRETGKPKGYGFCEYKDEETASSARRNLQGYEISGRQLRVDFAENEKGTADRNRDQGRGGPGLVDISKQTSGPKISKDLSLHQAVGIHVAVSAAGIMAGILGAPQTPIGSCVGGANGRAQMTDPLTIHLASMSRFQLFEVIHLMKNFIQQNQQSARQVLATNPQLTKALFQAQIILGNVPQMFPHAQNGQPSQILLSSQGQAHIPSGGQQQNYAFHMFPHPSQQQSSIQPTAFPPPQAIQVPQAPPSTVALPQQTQSQLPLQPPLPQTCPPSPGAAQAMAYEYSWNQQPAQQSNGMPPQFVSYQGMPPPLPSQPLPHHLQGGLAVSTISNTDSIAQLGRGTDTEIHCNSVSLANRNKLSSSNDSLLSNPSNQSQLSNSSMVGFPSSNVMDDQQGVVKSNTVDGASVMYPRQCSQPTAQLPSQQQTQVLLVSDQQNALLQQVINLTPEQLNSLPPEQRQQVLDLQQAWKNQIL